MKDNTITIHNHGFVRLVDHMGDDSRIVQSARVSYAGGTKNFREDRALIRYLLKNAHTSPFEQVVFTFHIKMPIFVARQWIRHRTARLNEISARYSVMEDEFYEPLDEDINPQSKDNKQGRDETLFPPETLSEIKGKITHIHTEAYNTYRALIDKNVAREIARVVLPTSLYTEMYWQIDLHNLFHLLKLRLHSHAQREIQAYAKALYSLIKNICPSACEAFEDYILHTITLSTAEKDIVASLLQNNMTEEYITTFIEKNNLTLSKREISALLQKFRIQ